jgi:uncharacterized membrane protein
MARIERLQSGARTAGPSRATEGLSMGLGWFSVGLGMAELLAPDGVAALIGAPRNRQNRTALQAAGLRELTAGLGILGQPNEPGWMLARVGGDVMDLALLAAGFGATNARRGRLGAATFAVLGVTALDLLAHRRLATTDAAGRPRLPEHAAMARLHETGVVAKQAITVVQPPGEVYRFLRRFENFPRFLDHVERVEALDDRRFRWYLRVTAGKELASEVEVLVDEPERRLAWRSSPGAAIEHTGDVHLSEAPGGRGTEVRVELRYRPPGGALGRAAARWLNALPKHVIQRELRGLKQVLELGEVVRSDASQHLLPHAARAEPVGHA